MTERESTSRETSRVQKKDNSSLANQSNISKTNAGSHPMTAMQRARLAPQSLTPADIMQLQKTMGNQAVCQLMAEVGAAHEDTGLLPELKTSQSTWPLQRVELPEEEEEIVQGKFKTVQREEIPEEEEEEPVQGKFVTAQREEIPEPEEEEPLQMKQANNTGLPDALKSGVESLSGIDMSDVRVHYGSDKPAQIGALAYTQGTDIHVAPGQEQHLPHEAWHVVQQAQGRVEPTLELQGMNINDNEDLEQEATRMGEQSLTVQG